MKARMILYKDKSVFSNEHFLSEFIFKRIKHILLDQIYRTHNYVRQKLIFVYIGLTVKLEYKYQGQIRYEV